MKRILLAGAALGALTFTAQAADLGYNPITAKPAMQAVSGDLGLYFGFWHDSYTSGGPSGSDSGSFFGGDARVNVWLSPGLSAQFDLSGSSFEQDSDAYTSMNIAGHLSWRQPTSLLGVMVSTGSNNYERAASIALEGQTYAGPFLLYGQGGFSTGINGDDASAWYIHGEARYFFNPNLMLSGNLGFASLDFDNGDDNDTLIRWGLDLETKFNASPFGAFASYKGSHYSYDNGHDTSHAFSVGLRIHLNNNTLQSASQAGATLKDFNPLTGVNSY
jgi:hypothetical protein